MKAKAEEMKREQVRYESAALCLMNELSEAADRNGWHFHDDAECNVWEVLSTAAELLDDLRLLNAYEATALVQMLVHYRVWAERQGTSTDKETAAFAQSAVLAVLRNNHKLAVHASAAQACVSAFNAYSDMMSDRRARDWEEEDAAKKAESHNLSTPTGGKGVLS